MCLKREILSYYSEEFLSNLKENKESYLKSYSFLHYYQIICTIKRYLLKSTNDYLEITFLKNYYVELGQNNQKLKKMQLEKIFYKFLLISNSLSKIQNYLEHNFSEKILKNPEICYLLTTFYHIITQNILKTSPQHF